MSSADSLWDSHARIEGPYDAGHARTGQFDPLLLGMRIGYPIRSIASETPT